MYKWSSENWGSIIIFHLSKLLKAKFSILMSCLWRGCRESLKLIPLGSERAEEKCISGIAKRKGKEKTGERVKKDKISKFGLLWTSKFWRKAWTTTSKLGFHECLSITCSRGRLSCCEPRSVDFSVPAAAPSGRNWTGPECLRPSSATRPPRPRGLSWQPGNKTSPVCDVIPSGSPGKGGGVGGVMRTFMSAVSPVICCALICAPPSSKISTVSAKPWNQNETREEKFTGAPLEHRSQGLSGFGSQRTRKGPGNEVAYIEEITRWRDDKNFIFEWKKHRKNSFYH